MDTRKFKFMILQETIQEFSDNLKFAVAVHINCKKFVVAVVKCSDGTKQYKIYYNRCWDLISEAEYFINHETLAISSWGNIIEEELFPQFAKNNIQNVCDCLGILYKRKKHGIYTGEGHSMWMHRAKAFILDVQVQEVLENETY